MMIVRYAAIAIVIVAAPAWATCYHDEDKFDGTTRHWCAAGGLGLGETLGLMSSDHAQPIPMALIQADGSASYAVKVIWKDQDWLFMEPGAKLVFLLADGSRIEAVTPSGSSIRKDINAVPGVGVFVREEAVFLLPDIDTMRRIADTDHAEFAVYGAKGRVEGSLDKDALKHYRALLAVIPF